MLHLSDSEVQFVPDEEEPRFPFLVFFMVVALWSLGAVMLYRWVAPRQFFQELTTSWWYFLILTAGAGLYMSLFEYLYHRYLLHARVLPFLGSMFIAHNEVHHHLTDVKAAVKAAEPTKLAKADNKYAVETEDQEEAMRFPYYSLPIFYLVFTVLVGLPLKWLNPTCPGILATILAATVAYSGYELWHAALHLPYTKYWAPKLAKSQLWRRVYGFHLMHHWVPRCNEAVFGFYLIAIWDHLFRTYRVPKRLPLPFGLVSYQDRQLPEPVWIIRFLDSKVGPMQKWARKVEGIAK